MIKQRKNAEYRILLAITQNPHIKDPNKLWDALNAGETEAPREEELDKNGMELLKLKMSSNPRMKIR